MHASKPLLISILVLAIVSCSREECDELLPTNDQCPDVEMGNILLLQTTKDLSINDNSINQIEFEDSLGNLAIYSAIEDDDNWIIPPNAPGQEWIECSLDSSKTQKIRYQPERIPRIMKELTEITHLDFKFSVEVWMKHSLNTLQLYDVLRLNAHNNTKDSTLVGGVLLLDERTLIDDNYFNYSEQDVELNGKKFYNVLVSEFPPFIYFYKDVGIVAFQDESDKLWVRK